MVGGIIIWKVLDLEEGTGSDYRVLEWTVVDDVICGDQGWKFKRWALGDHLKKEKEEERRGKHIIKLSTV